MPRVYGYKHSSASIVAALGAANSVIAASRAIGTNSSTITDRAKTDPAIAVALEKFGHRLKYSNAAIVAALEAAPTVAAAARTIGASGDATIRQRASRDPEIDVAFKACLLRSKVHRLSSAAKFRRDPKYNRDAIAKVLRRAPSRQAAADQLGITIDDLSNAITLSPKGLRPLYFALTKREPYKYRGKKYPTAQLIAALDAAPSHKAAGVALGIPKREIGKHLQLRRVDPDVDRAAKACAIRGRRLAQEKIRNNRPPYTGKKAEFCFRDYVGKLARLRRDLVTGNGRGVTYPKGTRFKIVKHAHHSFSIVRVDDMGFEIQADNAWGRYFIAGVTRNKLEFEETKSA